MRVFISWSGDRSRVIADHLRRWLPSVLQAVRPYFSPDDVAKGSRWSSEIAKELDASRVGLLVITPENQEAPWLVFEAGALAKNLDRSKVCPILFGGMEPTDVKGPLVQFQAAQFIREDMKRVVKMINGELGDTALAGDVLDGVFDMWWPRLEAQVTEGLTDDAGADFGLRRSERELLEEVLALSRRIAESDRHRRPEFDHPVWDDLFMGLLELARVSRGGADENVRTAMRRLTGPLEFIMMSEMRHGPGPSRLGRSSRRWLAELHHLLQEEPPAITQGDSGSEDSSG